MIHGPFTRVSGSHGTNKYAKGTLKPGAQAWGTEGAPGEGGVPGGLDSNLQNGVEGEISRVRPGTAMWGTQELAKVS